MSLTSYRTAPPRVSSIYGTSARPQTPARRGCHAVSVFLRDDASPEDNQYSPGYDLERTSSTPRNVRRLYAPNSSKHARTQIDLQRA